MEAIGIVYACVTAVLFGWWLKRTFKTFDQRIILLAWGIKVLGTFTLLALFTFYYTDRSTSDIHRFFDDGLLLNAIAFEEPGDFFRILFGWNIDQAGFRTAYFEHFNAWIKPHDSGFYNDNHVMIRLNALMAFISMGYIEVHSVWFSMLSFMGMLWMIAALLPPTQRNFALIVTALYPSQLIWLSAGLKESLLVFGLGMMLYGIHQMKASQRPLGIGFALLGCLLLTQVKVYFLLFLIPILAWSTGTERLKLRWLPSVGILGILILLGTILLEAFGVSPMEYTVRKQHEFINHAAKIQAGSAFDVEKMAFSYTSVIAQLPQAFSSTLLRPWPWEDIDAPSLLLLAENILLLILISIALWQLTRKNIGFDWPRWLIPYALSIILLIGLITPVYGALMRYRAPILLLLIIALSPYIRSLFKPSPS